MRANEYDRIVDLIEEKVPISCPELDKYLQREMGMTAGTISDTIALFNPDANSLKQYHRQRMAHHALSEMSNNPDVPKEEIAARYGYADYSGFYRCINSLFRCAPGKILEKGIYEIPPVKHVRELLEAAYPDEKNKMEWSNEEEEDYTLEVIKDDFFYAKQRKIEELKNEIRYTPRRDKRMKLKEKLEELQKQYSSVNEELENLKEGHLKIKNLTVTLYAEFLKIDECRRIYGIDPASVVMLYNESIEKDVPLGNLCDAHSDMLFMSGQEEEFEIDDPEELWEMHKQYLEDNMSLGESWNYYSGEEDDPYAEPDDPFEVTMDDVRSDNW